jgi:hypothetical protein
MNKIRNVVLMLALAIARAALSGCARDPESAHCGQS